MTASSTSTALSFCALWRRVRDPVHLISAPINSQCCAAGVLEGCTIADGYSTADISYAWAVPDKAVTIDKGVTLPQFDIDAMDKRQFGRRIIGLSTGTGSASVNKVRYTYHHWRSQRGGGARDPVVALPQECSWRLRPQPPAGAPPQTPLGAPPQTPL